MCSRYDKIQQHTELFLLFFFFSSSLGSNGAQVNKRAVCAERLKLWKAVRNTQK